MDDKEIMEQAEDVKVVHEVILGEVRSKKKSKKIIELIEDYKDLSRYSVYNAMTNYATHHAKNDKDSLGMQRKAEKVLLREAAKLKRQEWED